MTRPYEDVAGPLRVGLRDFRDALDAYFAEAAKLPGFLDRLAWVSMTPLQRSRVLRVRRIQRRTARRRGKR